MNGNKDVLEHLQSLLNGELAARDQYFIHSRMYEDWGLTKLYEQISHEMQDETDHADALIKRMLFLECQPDLSKPDKLLIGKTVPEMLQADLDVEYSVVDALKAAIKVCEKEQDYDTRTMLCVLLKDTEEDHAYWLEQQLGLINKIGLQNYLQSML